MNLIDFFDLSSNPTSKWWVLDSHRPLNLHNLFSSPQVVVIDDGTALISHSHASLLLSFPRNLVRQRHRTSTCI